MAIGEVVNNFTNVPGPVSAISDTFVGYFDLLVLIGKFLGAAFAIYLVYLLIMSIINWRKAKRVRRIEKKLDDLNEKVDLIMSKLKLGKKTLKKKKKN